MSGGGLAYLLESLERSLKKGGEWEEREREGRKEETRKNQGPTLLRGGDIQGDQSSDSRAPQGDRTE